MNQSTQDNQPPLYVEDFSPEKMPELERLIRQQAEHHKCSYAGRTENLLAAVTKAQPPLAHIFCVYASGNPERMLAYGLYSFAWTFGGKVVYMDDLCTDQEHRNGKGIGKFGFAAMRDIAGSHGIDNIVGTVMASNTGTVAFWKKQGAVEIPKKSYDLSNLFNKKAAIEQPIAYTATRITEPTDLLPAAALGALTTPNTGVFAFKDAQGETVALGMVNASYSSFRCVTGVAMEPVKFLKPLPESEKEEIVRTSLKAAHDFALEMGFTGHIYASAKNDCAAGNEVLGKLGDGLLRMNDDPASVFINTMVPRIPPSTPPAP